MIEIETLAFYGVGIFVVLMIVSRFLLPIYYEFKQQIKPKNGEDSDERKE